MKAIIIIKNYSSLQSNINFYLSGSLYKYNKNII